MRVCFSGLLPATYLFRFHPEKELLKAFRYRISGEGCSWIIGREVTVNDIVPHDDLYGVLHEVTPEEVIEKAIRENAHITRAKVAEKTGVSAKTISRKS